MWEAGSRSASIHTFLEAPAPAVRTACTTARPRLWQWVGASTKINLFQAGAGGHDAAMSRITPAGLALPTVRGPPGSSWDDNDSHDCGHAGRRVGLGAVEV